MMTNNDAGAEARRPDKEAEARQPEKAEATNDSDHEIVPVLCRFYRYELDDMKLLTGANADATAVACYCRKHLRA